MVIWFNVEKAREQLLKYGYVCTLRPKRRKEGIEVLSYNGFGNKGLVYVIFIKEIKDDNELKEYLEFSGFETVEEWRKEAKDSKFLYYVFTLGER
jgi:hypothetical protein